MDNLSVIQIREAYLANIKKQKYITFLYSFSSLRLEILENKDHRMHPQSVLVRTRSRRILQERLINGLGACKFAI